MTDTLKPISVHSARKTAEAAGADRIVVIYLAEDGEYGVTTWGKTRAICRHMAKLSEGRLMDLLLEAAAKEAPEAGLLLSAMEPETEAGEGVGKDVT